MPMLKMLMSVFVLSIATCVCSSFNVRAEDSDTEKYSTKLVMKSGFKGGLLKKVASGKASEEEKKKLRATKMGFVPKFKTHAKRVVKK